MRAGDKDMGGHPATGMDTHAGNAWHTCDATGRSTVTLAGLSMRRYHHRQMPLHERRNRYQRHACDNDGHAGCVSLRRTMHKQPAGWTPERAASADHRTAWDDGM